MSAKVLQWNILTEFEDIGWYVLDIMHLILMTYSTKIEMIMIIAFDSVL